MSHELTEAIIEWQMGKQNAEDKFQLVIYDHLRKLASENKQRIAKKHAPAPLEANIQSTTALVHEVFIKIHQGSQEFLSNRREFTLLVAKTVHNILVDHARKSNSLKRSAELTQIEDKANLLKVNLQADEKLIDLSDALADMEQAFPRQAQSMQLKYFGGLMIKEIAELFEISTSSAEKDIAFAKSWLKVRLST